MSEKLRAVRAKFVNVFGFEEFEFDLGKFTLIKGPNNKGKSTALEAIRSLWKGTAHDGTLLRQGAKKGEVVLILSDGVELAKQVLENKTLLTVKVPKLGEISRAPGFIKGLADGISLNPIEFLTAKPERQKELFLSALPLQVTREQLAEAVGFPFNIPTEGHALDVIAAAEKMFYTDRTEVNRNLKQKEAAAKQIGESLPKGPPEGDWATEEKQCERQVKDLGAELQGRKQMAERQSAEEAAALGRDVDEQITALRRVAQERIREIELALVENIEGTRKGAGHMAAEKSEALNATLATIEAEVTPQHQEWVQKAQHARTMAEQYVRAESARKLLDQMQQEAKALAEESDGLTQGIEGLRALRASLTAQLPIPGAEIRDGELYLDGIPLARVAESRLISLAVELAMLGAGELGLILVDGLEALDSHTLELFTETIKRYEAQVLGTKVVDGEALSVEQIIGGEDESQ